MTARAIQIRGLTKAFGSNRVLDGLDLDVERGEIFALLGANGAGKTTTISILTTLLPADDGVARVTRIDVTSQPEEVRRRIRLAGRSAAVDEALTRTVNLMAFVRLAELRTQAARGHIAELLEPSDLTRAPRTVSYAPPPARSAVGSASPRASRTPPRGSSPTNRPRAWTPAAAASCCT